MFTFKCYNIEKKTGTINFQYELTHNGESFSFTEKISFDPKRADFSRVPEAVLKSTLDTLSLILGVSYWKLFCPKELKLTEIKLSAEQAKFWNTVYTKGLGEFFYKNQIDFRGLVNFPASAVKVSKIESVEKTGRSLVLWGGGKDSIVTAEFLKKDGKDFDLFSLNDYSIQRETAKVLGKEVLIFKREIDPKLLELNKRPDAYNGHVPVSVIYSATALLASLLYGYDSVIISAEESANYGNVEYLGETINHQWSKSEEFEKMFSDYILKYITPSITFVSHLRKYNELEISEVFSKYPQYFSVFSSCNRNFTIAKGEGKKWCGECAKCAFVFAMLAAYLPKETVVKIFGKNLFDDFFLTPIYLRLWGRGEIKPFDCVGTPDETMKAFLLASLGGEYREDEVMKRYESLGRKKEITILGFGIEGQSTLRYFKHYSPSTKVHIADKNDDPKYLEKLGGSDLIIKTAGIPGRLVNEDYTTATNIFFGSTRRKIIGVTGTKGKSTTASLIYDILKMAGMDVKLVGNIGNPMLDELLTSEPIDRVYVAELSSYQLEDLKYSPHISVFINIFPDHLDYHDGPLPYWEAKKNIVAHATSKDYFVYNPEYALIKELAGETKAQAIPFVEALPFSESAIPLLGRHNVANVRAALTVARILNIKDDVTEKAVRAFKSLPHRLEKIGEYKGITFYDDAISTTPESTIAGLEALQNVDTIFLGGTDRGYDFTELAKKIFEKNISNVVLFPDSGASILKALNKVVKETGKVVPKILETNDIKKGVEFAYANTKSGHICLLSTASPSYSIWKNFEEKGDLFQRYVKELAKG